MSGASQTGADIEEFRTAMSELYAGKNAEKAAKKAEEAEEKARKYIERYVETMTEFREKRKGSGFFTPEQADDAEAYAEAVRSATDKIDDLRSQSEEAAAKGRTAAMKDREEPMQSLTHGVPTTTPRPLRRRRIRARACRRGEVVQGFREGDRAPAHGGRRRAGTRPSHRQLAAEGSAGEDHERDSGGESRELLLMLCRRTSCRRAEGAGEGNRREGRGRIRRRGRYMSELESYGSYEQKWFAIREVAGKINAADGAEGALPEDVRKGAGGAGRGVQHGVPKIFANVSDLSKAGWRKRWRWRGRLSKLISEGADVADIDAMSNRVNELQRAIDEFSFTGWTRRSRDGIDTRSSPQGTD